MPTRTIPPAIVADLTVLSEPQAAQLLGIDPVSLKAMRLDGTGPPPVQLTQRRFGYRATELDKWLDKRPREPLVKLSPEQRPQVADKGIELTRAVQSGDPKRIEEAAKAVNTSGIPLRLYLYELASLLAYADRKSDGTLLDALQRVAGTPT